MAHRFNSREWQNGWRIVAGAAVGMGTGSGLYLLVVSLFVVHISEAFGYTRGQIGIGQMVGFVTGAVALPLMGRLVDRLGFRPIVRICVPALALLYLMIALQPGYYPLHLALMVWGGIFGSGTGPIAYTRPLISAFQRDRGLALGMATAGTSVTAMIVPPVVAAVIGSYGWRAGLFTMAAITGLVGLPVALTLMRRVSVHAATAKPELAEGRAEAEPRVPNATLRDAVRTAPFWLLVVALVSINVPGSGIVSQLAPLVGDKGIPQHAAAFVLSIYAAGLLVGRLATGFALDRLPAWLVGAVMSFLPAAGVAGLLVPSPSFVLAATAVGLIGMQQGSEIDLIAYFVSRCFGATHYGAIYGAIAIAGALSTALALVFFGRVHDLTGSYDAALIVGGLAFCIGAIAFASIRPARHG